MALSITVRSPQCHPLACGKQGREPVNGTVENELLTEDDKQCGEQVDRTVENELSTEAEKQFPEPVDGTVGHVN